MSKTNKKVLICSNTSSSSYVFRRDLLMRLEERGQLIGVFSIKEDYIPQTPDIGFIKAISLVMKSPVPTLIHGFTHAGNLIAALISILTLSPLILTVTGMGRAYSLDGPREKLQRAFLWCFYKICIVMNAKLIVQNEDDRSFFIEMGAKLIYLTRGSGWQGSELDVTAERQNRIGYFGRCDPLKGIDNFYNVAKYLRHRSDYEFVQFGHPGKGKYSADEIKVTASGFNVNYCGHTLSPSEEMLGCDIVVAPSRYREGFSNSIIEALCQGCKVCALKTSGVNDLGDGKENLGLYLVDTVDDLAASISSAMENQIDRANTSRYWRGYFSKTLVLGKYFSSYDG